MHLHTSDIRGWCEDMVLRRDNDLVGVSLVDSAIPGCGRIHSGQDGLRQAACVLCGSGETSKKSSICVEAY